MYFILVFISFLQYLCWKIFLHSTIFKKCVVRIKKLYLNIIFLNIVFPFYMLWTNWPHNSSLICSHEHARLPLTLGGGALFIPSSRSLVWVGLSRFPSSFISLLSLTAGCCQVFLSLLSFILAFLISFVCFWMQIDLQAMLQRLCCLQLAHQW